MRGPSQVNREQVRNKLVRAILGDDPAFVGDLQDSTSLIRSGLVDSQRLVEISLVVEESIGHSVDFSSVDLEREWDTITSILEFVERQR